MLLAAAAAVALVIVGGGCGEDDIEEVLGDASAASVESAYGVDGDPLLNEWLNTAGQTIVSHSRRQHIPYEFKVIQTDQVNAFAAPYGHVYVTSGFLDFAETEDEVWMVLGHEVGHIVHRDSIHSFKKSLLWGILTQIIRGESRTAGDILGIGLGLLSLQYSRDDEYEADDAGTMLAYRCGYDPHVGLAFFDRLMTDVEKRRPSRWEVYFMTHPPTERRLQRQLERAELDEASAEPLVQIARGYLLRAQPAKAARLLERGLELAPGRHEIHTLLGDAYAMRGYLRRAGEHYRVALSLEDGNRYAEERLASLSDAPARALEGIAAPGRAQAGELLADLDEAERMAQRLQANAQSYGATRQEETEGLVRTVKGINERLLTLAEWDREVQDATERLVVRGNAAISRATESVYVLENVNEDLEEVGAEIAALLEESEVALQAARAGEGNPDDLPALHTAIAELKRATATLDLAATEAPKALADVRTAQSAAGDVASLMELVLRRDEPEGPLADQLRNESAHTQRLGIDALHAVNRARRQSVKARGHALVARLNLLGVAADPYLQEVFDRQVSHCLLVPEAQVRAVRETGAGYGEAAMAIAAAKSADADMALFVPTVAGGISPVGEATEHQAAVSNANVLLKFLAASMQAERDAEMVM